LAAATDNFCEERKLGEGFFGVVYSGYMKKFGCHVAVKEILNKSNVVPGPNNSVFYAKLNAITSEAQESRQTRWLVQGKQLQLC
jgi:hypothetical protein